jgi:NADH:ubiquinone reductase (non-electrogenic)
MMTTSSKPRIVVLGTGFAGFSFVKAVDTRLAAVTVISPRNHFLFTPLLPSTTVGTVEFRSIIEPVRSARRGIEYYQASCTSVDVREKLVSCKGALDAKDFSLPFDKLVIAVGARSSTFGVPGVERHTKFLRDLADARAIRQAMIDNFEQASSPATSEEERRRLLHLVVVGGGPTGVEVAAEIHDFVTEDLRKSYAALMPLVRITLLEAADHILNTFDAVLSDYTMRLFQRQRIEVRTNSPVTLVEEHAMHLRDGSVVPFGLAVWSTGIGPQPFVDATEFPKDADGRLVIDEYLRVVGSEDLYAAGDCASVTPSRLPATAQVAQQQGAYLARAMKRRLTGTSVPPFTYRHYGMLAYVGSGRALADLSTVKGRGFVTWLFWRSAYLTRLVSLKNKLLVLFDWFKTFIFGRDISRF